METTKTLASEDCKGRVSEELNSVETPQIRASRDFYRARVSEELNSVETKGMNKWWYIKNLFQKNLIVWKPFTSYLVM